MISSIDLTEVKNMRANKMEILLIEDNLSEANLIREMLSEDQRVEFSVQHVQRLAEGLTLLKEQNFDVVLVDLGLPDSQGLESALIVRRQSRRTPVIALTVLDDEDMALKSLQLGIQDYLIKCEINGSLLSRSIRYAIQRKRDSEVVREIEDRFSAFMLHLPAAAWMKDLLGRYVYVNAETQRIFSASSSDLIGRTDEDFLPADTARLFADNDRRVLQAGGSLQTTETLCQADGAERKFAVSKFAVFDPDGQPAYVAGIALDITEATRLKSELQRLASFPLMNPNPILELDASGRMTFCNPSARKMLDSAGYDDVVNPLVPKDMPMMLQSLRGDKTDQFYRQIEIDGRYFEELIVPLPQLQTMRIYTMETTGRERAERALKTSEERLQFASKAAGIGTWHWDMVSKELIWSDRCKEFFGYPPDFKMTYEAFLQAVSEEDRQQVDAAVQKALRDQTEYSVMMRVILPDGHLRWIMSIGRALYDDQGQPVRMDGIATDVTEHKQAEDEIRRLNAELAAANRDLEAFNYTVAHDLRQPLNLVSMNCQAIEMMCGEQLQKDCLNYVKMSYNGVLRMTRLIDALLNLSHVAHVEPRRERVDLSVMAQKAAEELKLAESGRKVDFRIADGVVVDGDASLLQVVLDNLLGNAWKYTDGREKAVIEFNELEIDGNRVYFVRDNGPGFDMADADQLFVPFKRLPGAEASKGFGIGLATVAKIIRRHGGKVWAEGVPDKGACFYFTLPAAGEIHHDPVGQI